ncbi:bifunctional acetate--CoA ligase family protein/GNAT family N-acetyltransferase [Allokutzneria albata]|uniref:Acyl-CoA synthetase (NDP forming) n=1 Tax=Allokutzneria albata TaxID=211114 RepID=A0A1G9SJX1_ALLAB|nr:bifunctional GNAT family N-acetyltransferase/acetate--CoA ligase family protein [Allokutzneria albata]SDM35783.1 Acyl-CoA synthetase (NDP forming) [Allokutzneria albata]
MTAVRALLADGRPVLLREVTDTDLPALRALHEDLPAQDRYMRFFSMSRTVIEHYVRRFGHGADARFGALGAWLDGELVGVASYHAMAEPEHADIAVSVAHPEQAHGVGTLLLEHLGSLARRRGMRYLHADVLAVNARMLQVLTDCGLPAEIVRDSSTMSVTLRLTDDESYQEAVRVREMVADRASLSSVLRPASVAVIGAGRSPGSVGNAVLRNLVEGGFRGGLWPVNPKAETVAGLPSYPDVASLPRTPELAVICVPARAVPDVAEQCGNRGVKALVVVTAGITEHPELADGLRAAVVKHGMRLVGPNCLGVINTDPAAALHAGFSRPPVPAGDVGVVTQSGGVGIAVLERLGQLGLGVSTMVSTGDKYDISGNDVLMWWARDERTRLAVLYLESFGNPRKFSRLARHLGASTPVVAVRSGTSETAQRAAASHTAAAATPAVTRDAVFAQAGVIVVDDLDDLVDVVALLRTQPLPSGPAVAVVGNAGGIGVLAADALARQQLDLPRLADETTRELRAVLPAHAGLSNPVDTTAGVSAETFAHAVRQALTDPGVHAVCAISVPTALGDAGEGVGDLAELAAQLTKPLVLVRPGQRTQVELVPAGAHKVPSYSDPSGAARALRAALRYARWRSRDPGVIPDLPDIDVTAARAVLVDCPESGWLAPDQVRDVLEAFGIPLVPSVLASTPEQVVAAQRYFDWPVALKVVADDVLHKSDVGGVLLDVGADAVAESAAGLWQRFGNRLKAVEVQPMAEPGVELLIGVTSDDRFGPLIACGLGGVATDVLADRAFRLVPLTTVDAEELVESLRSAPLLHGYRGAEPVDVAAVHDVLLRVARLAELLPEVAELDLNPVLAGPRGCVAVDARIRVVPREAIDPWLRRLRL